MNIYLTISVSLPLTIPVAVYLVWPLIQFKFKSPETNAGPFVDALSPGYGANDALSPGYGANDALSRGYGRRRRT
jgi:hypothetical protein